MNEPTTGTHHEAVAGKLSARRRPVSIAEKSDIVTGFLRIFSYPHSKTTEDTIETMISIKALIPK